MGVGAWLVEIIKALSQLTVAVSAMLALREDTTKTDPNDPAKTILTRRGKLTLAAILIGLAAFSITEASDLASKVSDKRHMESLLRQSNEQLAENRRIFGNTERQLTAFALSDIQVNYELIVPDVRRLRLRNYVAKTEHEIDRLVHDADARMLDDRQFLPNPATAREGVLLNGPSAREDHRVQLYPSSPLLPTEKQAGTGWQYLLNNGLKLQFYVKPPAHSYDTPDMQFSVDGDIPYSHNMVLFWNTKSHSVIQRVEHGRLTPQGRFPSLIGLSDLSGATLVITPSVGYGGYSINAFGIKVNSVTLLIRDIPIQIDGSQFVANHDAGYTTFVYTFPQTLQFGYR